MSRFEGMMIASDMDGTLLNDAHEISKENLDAIKYFTDNGGKFTVSTGRAVSAALPCIKGVLDTPVSGIFLNGAVIFDITHNKVEYMKGMPQCTLDIVKDIMEHFPELGIEIFCMDHIYVCHYNHVTKMHFDIIKVPFIEKDIDSVPSPENWCKVNLTHDFDYLIDVKKHMEQYNDLFSMSSSTKVFFEITNKEDNKGAAVKTLAQKHHITKLYTVGDNYNDIPMIEVADIGFAPENAEQSVKNVADMVVSSNNNHCIRDIVTYLDKNY